MVLAPVALAPLLIVLAARVERRLGPSAAGWVAALPVAFAVAVVAVILDAGSQSASVMALSAAAHVPAQVGFGVACAALLVRRGLLIGVLAGALVYVTGSVLVAAAPALLAVFIAVPVLVLAPRRMTRGRPSPPSSGRAWTTGLGAAAAAAIVGAAILTSRLAGPELAGAVAAFPTMCTTLALAIAARDGRAAGAFALTGLVRSLPCYLTFCLVVAAATPALGLAAVVLALAACTAVACCTWRAVPVALRPAAPG